jgi:N-acetylglutamate synthase-like GNAT family acetyltransferase
VLEEAGAVRGVLVLEQHADHLLLENVAVEPARRGEGEGRALLDFAEAEARRRGLPEVHLYTNALMERNIALYAALGYVESERRREEGFRRVFMAKRVG